MDSDRAGMDGNRADMEGDKGPESHSSASINAKRTRRTTRM